MISIIDPDQPPSLEQRLTETLASIRSQIRSSSGRSRKGGTSDTYLENETMSLTRSRDIHKLLVLARSREADLQDAIDTLKSESEEKDDLIRSLRRQLDEQRKQAETERESHSRNRREMLDELETLRVELAHLSKLQQRQLGNRSQSNLLSRQTGKVLSTPELLSGPAWAARKAGRPQSASPTRPQMYTRPQTPPPKFILTSAVIPDISKQFRNAKVVSDIHPLFRVNTGGNF
jgi:hypothetical protein